MTSIIVQHAIAYLYIVIPKKMQLALSKWVILNDPSQSTPIKNKIKPKERKIQVQTIIGDSSGHCQIRIAPFMSKQGATIWPSFYVFKRLKQKKT